MAQSKDDIKYKTQAKQLEDQMLEGEGQPLDEFLAAHNINPYPSHGPDPAGTADGFDDHIQQQQQGRREPANTTMNTGGSEQQS
ncbi:hypothetical protein M5689_018158 [Euphorbia peplus]|nr:hypothetical protein M5689_018158 [Euphorbia peplus]